MLNDWLTALSDFRAYLRIFHYKDIGKIELDPITAGQLFYDPIDFFRTGDMTEVVGIPVEMKRSKKQYILFELKSPNDEKEEEDDN